MSGSGGQSGGPSDPYNAMHEALGNIGELELEDLGAPSPPKKPAAPVTEDSFADARLDAPAGEALTSGDSQAAPGPGGPQQDAQGEQGLDLALVSGGAVIVSARDKGLGKKREPVAETPTLQQRGATAIAAPSQLGPTPAGHVARPRGIFAWDPVTNALAALAVGLLVAALPAYLMASSHADSEEVQASFDRMKSLRGDLLDLADPGRENEGPQGTEAVATALSAVASGIEAEGDSVQESIDGAHLRFWGVWFGVGLPLVAALALLKRKP